MAPSKIGPVARGVHRDWTVRPQEASGVWTTKQDAFDVRPPMAAGYAMVPDDGCGDASASRGAIGSSSGCSSGPCRAVDPIACGSRGLEFLAGLLAAFRPAARIAAGRTPGRTPLLVREGNVVRPTLP